MRALTIKQPWAHLIAKGTKDIENRDWLTHYRGPIAIHAGLARDRLDTQLPRGVPRPRLEELEFGAIIAVADLVDICERSRSKWFEGRYGWVLRNARPLGRPIACKGAVSLWLPSPAILRQIRAQL